jgi:translation initiation factor IF-3
MNTQERWNYIKNNKEIIEQYMAEHDEEVKTRQLLKFLQKDKKVDHGRRNTY